MVIWSDSMYRLTLKTRKEGKCVQKKKFFCGGQHLETCGPLIRDQTCALFHWKHGILLTGTSGKSLTLTFETFMLYLGDCSISMHKKFPCLLWLNIVHIYNNIFYQTFRWFPIFCWLNKATVTRWCHKSESVCVCRTNSEKWTSWTKHVCVCDSERFCSTAHCRSCINLHTPTLYDSSIIPFNGHLGPHMCPGRDN